MFAISATGMRALNPVRWFTRVRSQRWVQSNQSVPIAPRAVGLLAELLPRGKNRSAARLDAKRLASGRPALQSA